MSILVNKNSRVITQGMTGKTGQFHTRLCRDYGFGPECFVGGVNPKKAGQEWEDVYKRQIGIRRRDSIGSAEVSLWPVLFADP